MTVLLHTSNNLPADRDYDCWLAVTGTDVRLDRRYRIKGLPRRLETCFDEVREHWLALGAQFGQHPVGNMSHAGTGATYISDFGLMLAWSRLASNLVASHERALIICDDPWLFRHLRQIPGVMSSSPPAILPKLFALLLRGLSVRFFLSIRLFFSAIALRRTRAAGTSGDTVLIVYGHPRSTADGYDAYFGTLLSELPEARKALHTDCGIKRARELCRDQRTFSLHGWGSPMAAARLLGVWWRYPGELKNLDECWLLRRAIVLENSAGALAMTYWQRHCQDKWLAAGRPKVVVWPWENHPWERSLVRSARRSGARTVGYQHAVIGRHQLNFSPRSNPDGEGSLPDKIICNGPAYRDQLLRLGHPGGKLVVGGAFRSTSNPASHHDPAGPVYIALSAIRPISHQMIDAATGPQFRDIHFVVKDHPNYPMPFNQTNSLQRTELTIPESGGLRAVVYSTGMTGLEGVLAGVPTYRFLPNDRIAPDTMPDGLKVPECTAEELLDLLQRPAVPQSVTWADIMTPVDVSVWKAALTAEQAE